MDISTLFQRSCHVEIRRLLFLIGMIVAAAVVFQCSVLPYRNRLSLSHPDNGSAVSIVSNASILDDSRVTKIYVVDTVANDTFSSLEEEEEKDGYDKESEEANKEHDLALDTNGYVHESFHRYKHQNSQGKFKFEKSAMKDESIINGSVTDRDNSYAQVKTLVIEHNHLEQAEKKTENDKVNNGPKAANSSGTAPVMSTQGPIKGTENSSADSRTSDFFLTSSTSSMANVGQNVETQQKNAELLQAVSVILNNNSVRTSVSLLRRLRMQPIPISQMNSLYLQRLGTPDSPRPLWSSSRDRDLLYARLEIQNAPVLRNTPGLYASVFRNVSMFKRSYELMESTLKVYVYKEGETPIFHQPKMRGIYASEGWFMKLMERNKNFVVRDPRRAHLFYLPFSVKMLRTALGQDFLNQNDLNTYLRKYVQLIAGKYKFWNRTGGADHFLVACHDWAPKLTKQHMKNCIRALCNANAAKGFKIGKDTTLPVTYIHSIEAPLEHLGGKPPSERSFLAFFAGSMHGYLRPVLLQYWENKEADMKIFGPMPRDVEGLSNYREHMKSSKYCICARGYEVHTPRVVEAIFHECVPVIISDNYVPPFFEVLNWEAFSVFILEKDIPNLRNILLSIPEEKYLAMQSRVKMVQKHFLWHKKPVKYDLFHMILHSIWYNRVFLVKTR